MSFTAYKAFNRDQTCLSFKYEEGQTYEMEGKPVLCEKGFHFCKDLVLTLAYYPVRKSITENLYAEVEVLGDVEFEEPTKHKGVTNKIKIVKFLSDEEVLGMVDSKFNSGDNNSGHGNSGDHNSGNNNSGHYNSGNRNSGWNNSGNRNSGDNNSGNRNSGNNNSGHGNSGDRNSGWHNSGDRNSGWYNSGDRNSGDNNSGKFNAGNNNSGDNNSGDYNSGNWNKSNFNSGHLNDTENEYTIIFNKPCLKSDWNVADIPYFMYFELLPNKSYKESFIESYNKASLKDKKKVLKLPNFDKDIFFNISGIDVSDIM